MVTDHTTQPVLIDLETDDLRAAADFLTGSMTSVGATTCDLDPNWTACAPQQVTLHAASPLATKPGPPCCSYR